MVYKQDSKSLMCKNENIGDSTEPCGTPELMSMLSQQLPSVTALILLLDSKVATQHNPSGSLMITSIEDLGSRLDRMPSLRQG